jgi:hypothetical protein
MKPVCDDDEEAVCNMNGTWSCEKGGCSIENKPDCPHPVCSQGRWICYNKFPDASLSLLMDLSTNSGMGGMNLIVQQCDPLTADDCDPSYFLPISIDSSSYSQNLYSGFQMRGTVPFTTESNITTFLWNIQENPTPILQMDLDFESVIMNGAGTNRCAINLVLIDPSTSAIIASCNITKNSSNTFSQIINSNTPLVTTDEPFPKYGTDWVFYFDSTLKVATIGFALQFSTTYDDMEHSAFYNILPLGMNGPRSFIISSTTKN